MSGPTKRAPRISFLQSTMTTTTPTSNPIPSIDSAAQGAPNTNGILDAHETTTPPENAEENVPGWFPDEPAGAPAAAPSGETLLATAKAYLPAQDDVQRAITNAAQAAKAYLPQGVAAYLPSSSESNSDLTPPRPAFATPDRASTNLSTEAQAGSIGPPYLDSPSTSTTTLSTPSADLDNLSTLVHTGGPASLHPVAPLGTPIGGSRLAENLVASPSALSDAAPVIPPPPTSTTTDTQRAGPDVAAPSPHGVLALDSSAPPSPSQSQSAPAEPPAADAAADEREGSPHRKPKLVQRLKEKMHVGHKH
ncbi:hypothetical protein DFH09DRAFT_1421025 [Mycena vulgaris]|nr:hypothetical protein DFH09DRAFT_1421025 [Mycena vulgaris]